MSLRVALAILLAACLFSGTAQAKRLHFEGYDFKIKEGKGLGPGPNDWARSQAFVDTQGRLHLRFSEKDGRWYAGEVSSISRFGFGTYEITFEGDIGGMNKNVVFGFFNYPAADVGPDGTNEIDIEFSHWGDSAADPLNYTVWPVDPGLRYAHKTFNFRKGRRRSVHRFTWKPDRVVYSSAEINDDGSTGNTAYWSFKPNNPKKRIGQQPMSIFFNLWGFRGLKPSDGKPVEVIVDSFTYTPLK
jgi:hypothetical protein